MRKFDLNIDKILEDWNVEHALREIIANALDEQQLSKSQDIRIEKRGDCCWSIRDFGRGIKYEHFVQNESKEKQIAQGVIGKFGIGLKDALATFDRNNVRVNIYSKHGDIRIERLNKGGFNDIITLHAIIEEPSRPMMTGTEFVMDGVSDSDMARAKSFFLKFSNHSVLETTRLGEIIERNPHSSASIYVNGVKIASEDNFLFCYNITSLNTALRKALNRERTNVGRTAYTPSIRAMLLEAEEEKVIDILSEDLKRYSSGMNHDELKWSDVQMHTTKLLNSRTNVVFVTAEEMLEKNDLVHEAERTSQIVVIPENLQEKIKKENEQQEIKRENEPQEHETAPIKTMEVFVKERSDNFEYDFVDVENLSWIERHNYKYLESILDAIGGKPEVVKQILVAEKMQRDSFTYLPANGIWDNGRVIIKRSVLGNIEEFSSVLIHEIAHAKSGCTDGTRGFENQLTDFLGVLGRKYLDLLKRQ